MKYRKSIRIVLMVAGLVCLGCGDADDNAGLQTPLDFSPSGATFRDNGNGTVTNESTGLVWQLADSPTRLFFTEPGFGSPAAEYCENLNLAGGGWRLPTLNELLSLVDTSRGDPTIVDPFRPHTASPDQFYWTSTRAPMAASYYGVYFRNGRASELPAGQSWCVRCCR